MLSTDYVTYLNHEGRAYQAQLMALDADNFAALMVYGGEAGAWTVEHVPHASNPERSTPGAYWDGTIPEPDIETLTFEPETEPTPTLDDVPAPELAPVEPTPKQKRAPRVVRN